MNTHTAICFPSGNAATHDTAPDEMGFLSVLSSRACVPTPTLGVEEGSEEEEETELNCRVSQTSMVQFRRPA